MVAAAMLVAVAATSLAAREAAFDREVGRKQNFFKLADAVAEVEEEEEDVSAEGADKEEVEVDDVDASKEEEDDVDPEEEEEEKQDADQEEEQDKKDNLEETVLDDLFVDPVADRKPPSPPVPEAPQPQEPPKAPPQAKAPPKAAGMVCF